MTKAYLNALSESSKAEILEWLVKLDTENDELRERLRVQSESAPIPESHGDDAMQAKLRAAVREAFEHGVCVKARYTTRGDKWRATHAEAIKVALEHPEAVEAK